MMPVVFVVYEYEACLHFVFIEQCEKKLKKMFVGRSVLIIPLVFHHLYITCHLSFKVGRIFMLLSSLSFPARSSPTVLELWSGSDRHE